MSVASHLGDGLFDRFQSLLFESLIGPFNHLPKGMEEVVRANIRVVPLGGTLLGCRNPCLEGGGDRGVLGIFGVGRQMFKAFLSNFVNFIRIDFQSTQEGTKVPLTISKKGVEEVVLGHLCVTLRLGCFKGSLHGFGNWIGKIGSHHL